MDLVVLLTYDVSEALAYRHTGSDS